MVAADCGAVHCCRFTLVFKQTRSQDFCERKTQCGIVGRSGAENGLDDGGDQQTLRENKEGRIKKSGVVGRSESFAVTSGRR